MITELAEYIFQPKLLPVDLIVSLLICIHVVALRSNTEPKNEKQISLSYGEAYQLTLNGLHQ